MIRSISQTLLGLLFKGGWLMIPLAALSLLSLYVIVERLLTYRTWLYASGPFLEVLESHFQDGKLEAIHQLCVPQENSIQVVIYKGLTRYQQGGIKNSELVFENESHRAISFLEARLSLLATIAGVAPMIGFLGTVTGMIQTFMTISQDQQHFSSPLFFSGIYEAMVTTVGGLVVAIIAYLGYNYFVARVNRHANQLTYFVNLCLIHMK